MAVHVRDWWLALACLIATVLPGATPAIARAGASITITAPISGLTLRVDPRGAYTITARRPAWTFTGATGGPLSALATHTGSDRLGRYTEVSFSQGTSASLRAGIRLYAARAAVLFTLRYLVPNAAPVQFPILATYPRDLFHLSYRGHFAIYTFHGLSPSSPWLWFNRHDDAFLLSPAANLLNARTTMGPTGAVASGIDPAITRLPQGFTQQTLLVVGHGINAVYDAWGQAMTRLQGKTRPTNEATTELRYLGYWTDAGASYYYNYDRSLGYAGTLLAVRQEFQRLHIPLGYLQLDSWWYPKGSSATWQGNGLLRGGIYRYVAAVALFPQGLAGFHRQVGLPLIVHARWIDPSSPYRRQYRMSGNVITDPRYWQHTAAYLSQAGVIAYEQDWLGSFAHAALNLSDPAAFLDQMAAATQARGISLQYCMPLPEDLLQSTRYGNLMTTRVSEDHFKPSHWTSALYDSRLTGALGVWPWTDVFMSSETDNLLLSNLSAGIVGVGDPLGAVNAANLAKVMRGDGMLVKPDVPLVPTDPTYLADAAGIDQPMVAYTYTDHGTARTLYVFAYRRRTASLATFQPAALGLPGPVYVYNYFSRIGHVLAPGATFRDPVASGSYYLVVPIGRSGMALLGDLGRFVSMGTARIARYSDSGRIQATITFGAGEGSVVISGYAPRFPVLSAREGRIDAVSYDRLTHIFRARVSPGPSRSATLVISEPPIPVA
ncbi:MAG TPA: hypothetical protein VNL71_20340 [Chloroflexota bacterium]|nr:hypothetical protein [Chloroflexota bacterium]